MGEQFLKDYKRPTPMAPYLGGMAKMRQAARGLRKTGVDDAVAKVGPMAQNAAQRVSAASQQGVLSAMRQVDYANANEAMERARMRFSANQEQKRLQGDVFDRIGYYTSAAMAANGMFDNLRKRFGDDDYQNALAETRSVDGMPSVADNEGKELLGLMKELRDPAMTDPSMSGQVAALTERAQSLEAKQKARQAALDGGGNFFDGLFSEPLSPASLLAKLPMNSHANAANLDADAQRRAVIAANEKIDQLTDNPQTRAQIRSQLMMAQAYDNIAVAMQNSGTMKLDGFNAAMDSLGSMLRRITEYLNMDTGFDPASVLPTDPAPASRVPSSTGLPSYLLRGAQ